MALYTLSLVSRRNPIGSFDANAQFLETHQFLNETFPDHSHALSRAFQARNVQLWGYRNGSLVGAAITSHPTPLEGELHFFAVAPELRRTGVGRAFYEALELDAFKGQARVIATSAVPGFFQKIGFFNKGVTHTYRGQSEYYLIRAK